MGKARIVSGGTDGQYVIELDLGFDRVATRLQKLTEKIAALTAEITPLEGALETVELALTESIAALDLAISEYALVMGDANSTAEQREAARAKVTAAYTVKENAAIPVRFLKQKLGLLRIQRSSLESEKKQLDEVDTLKTKIAWCADLTEFAPANASVATIEVPGELGTILVAPGARAPVAADGKFLAREAMSGPQAYFNAAILPGWQKFKPTYRFGTITFLDAENNLADVSLQAATSSAQALNVNRETELTDVPIEYMTCNAAAFEEGDEVVVQFVGQNFSQPKVIGFKTNPKPCIPWTARWTDGARYAWTTNQVALFDSIMNASPLGLVIRSDSGSWSGMYEFGSIPGVRRSFAGTIQTLPGGGTAAYPPFADFSYQDSSTGTILDRVFRFNLSGASGFVGSDHVRFFAVAGTTEVMWMAATIDAAWAADVRGQVNSPISIVGTSNPITKLSPFEMGPRP